MNLVADRDRWGRAAACHCRLCRRVFDSMFGDICKRCADEEERLDLERRKVAALERLVSLSRHGPRKEDR